MKFLKKKLTELKPAKYNPRKKLKPGDPDYEKLKRSIVEFGTVDPIVWNKRTGNIVGGHQRYFVLYEMGVEETQVSVVDLDEKKEKILNIALNKISGDWDFPMLKDLISEIDDGSVDISLSGFDDDELQKMFGITTTDAAVDQLSSEYTYQVVITCDDETQQAEVIEEMEERGLKCQPLIL